MRRFTVKLPGHGSPWPRLDSNQHLLKTHCGPCETRTRGLHRDRVASTPTGLMALKNKPHADRMLDQPICNFPYPSSIGTSSMKLLRFLNAPFFERAQGRCGLLLRRGWDSNPRRLLHLGGFPYHTMLP